MLRLVLSSAVTVPLDQRFILLCISTAQHEVSFRSEKPVEFLEPMHLTYCLQIAFDFLRFESF